MKTVSLKPMVMVTNLQKIYTNMKLKIVEGATRCRERLCVLLKEAKYAAFFLEIYRCLLILTGRFMELIYRALLLSLYLFIMEISARHSNSFFIALTYPLLDVCEYTSTVYHC